MSDTWKNPERAAFNYFMQLFGATEGKQAFIGAAPVGSFNTWDFGLVRVPRSPFATSTGNLANVSSWMTEGRLRGVFTTRDLAVDFLGTLMDGLPITPSNGRKIDYVQTMRLVEHELGSGWASFTNSRREQLVANLDVTLEVVICTTP